MNINFHRIQSDSVKTALAMMGMIEESFRLPMCPASEKNREKIKSILADLEVDRIRRVSCFGSK